MCFFILVFTVCKRTRFEVSSLKKVKDLKIVSMIKKYHIHKPKTNLWHREEEPHNTQEAQGRQTKQSRQLSLLYQDDCKIRMDIK